jgi:hypothetical protein
MTLLPRTSALVVLNSIHASLNGGWGGATLSREMELLCGAIPLAIVLKDTWGCQVLVGSIGSRVMFAPRRVCLSGQTDGRIAHVPHLCSSKRPHCDTVNIVCAKCMLSAHNRTEYFYLRSYPTDLNKTSINPHWNFTNWWWRLVIHKTDILVSLWTWPTIVIGGWIIWLSHTT